MEIFTQDGGTVMLSDLALPGPLPVLTLQSESGGGLRFRLEDLTPGHALTLQYREALDDVQGWQTLEAFSATAAEVEKVYPDEAAALRLYRLKAE